MLFAYLGFNKFTRNFCAFSHAAVFLWYTHTQFALHIFELTNILFPILVFSVKFLLSFIYYFVCLCIWFCQCFVVSRFKCQKLIRSFFGLQHNADIEPILLLFTVTDHCLCRWHSIGCGFLQYLYGINCYCMYLK